MVRLDKLKYACAAFQDHQHMGFLAVMRAHHPPATVSPISPNLGAQIIAWNALLVTSCIFWGSDMPSQICMLFSPSVPTLHNGHHSWLNLSLPQQACLPPMHTARPHRHMRTPLSSISSTRAQVRKINELPFQACFLHATISQMHLHLTDTPFVHCAGFSSAA